MVCTNSAVLYCSPTKNAGCTDNQTYILEYNKAFKSINKVSQVDIYLFHGDDGSLGSKILGQPNDGAYSFTLDKFWFTDPPTTTTQFFPYRWYVVQAGKQFNVAPSSASMGDIFYAVLATSTKAGTTSQIATTEPPRTSARATGIVASTSTVPHTTAGRTAIAGSAGFPTASSTAVAANVAAASGVSSGAVAGIVIAVIGSVAAIAIAFFIFRRRRQQKSKIHSFRGPFDTEKFAPSKGDSSRGSKDTEMDVPLTFAPGTAPGTPKTLPGTPRVGTSTPRERDGSQGTLVGVGSGYETMTPPRSPNRQLIQSFPVPTPTTSAAPSPVSAQFPLSPTDRAPTPSNGSIRSRNGDSPPGQAGMPGPLSVRPQSPMRIFPPNSRPGTPVRQQFQGPPPPPGSRPQTPSQLSQMQRQSPPYPVGPNTGSRPGTPTQQPSLPGLVGQQGQGPPSQYEQGQPMPRGMGPQGPPGGGLPYPVGAAVGTPRMRPQTPQANRRQSPPQNMRPQTPQNGQNPFSDPRDMRRPQTPQNGPFADPRRPQTPRERSQMPVQYPPRSQTPQGQYPPRSQNPNQRPPPGPRSSPPVEPQPALVRSNSKRGIDAAFPVKKPMNGSVDLGKAQQLPWDDIDPPYMPAKVTPAKVSVVNVGDQGQRASIKSVEGRVTSGSTVRDSAGSVAAVEKEVVASKEVKEVVAPAPVEKDVKAKISTAMVTPTTTVTPPTDDGNTSSNPFQTYLPALPSMIVQSPSPTSVFTMPETTNSSSVSLPQISSRPTSSLVDIYSRDSFIETAPLSIAKAPSAPGPGEQRMGNGPGVDELGGVPRLPALEQGRPLSLGI